MLFIINGFSFYIVLLSSSEGISAFFLPSNNSFPSNQHENSEYSNTSVNKALELNVDIESPSGKVVDAWSKLDNLSAAGKIRAHHS